MMSLYFIDKVRPYSGADEVETLPPMEALVLGTMCLNKTYNSRAFSNRFLSHRTFDSRECDVFIDAGILGLLQRGYLKPASKKLGKHSRLKRTQRFGALETYRSWLLPKVPNGTLALGRGATAPSAEFEKCPTGTLLR